MPSLEQGRIVWAELPSSDGTTKKRRPAVIVTRTSDIVASEPFEVVSASTNSLSRFPMIKSTCLGIATVKSARNFANRRWPCVAGRAKSWYRISFNTAVLSRQMWCWKSSESLIERGSEASGFAGGAVITDCATHPAMPVLVPASPGSAASASRNPAAFAYR